MDALNRIETGIEYIRTRGNATGQELAEVLNCPKKNVQPTLYLAISTGYLATTKEKGSNIYRISETVPEGMSWAEFKESRRGHKEKSAPVKPPSKAKVIVEKPERPERTPAEVRNALADIFERRALGLPTIDDEAPTIETLEDGARRPAVEAAEQGYEVIELDPEPVTAAAIAALPSPVNAPVRSLRRFEVRFLFGCDGRLQVNLGDRRIICTREETAAVGRMMSALEPVWNV